MILHLQQKSDMNLSYNAVLNEVALNLTQILLFKEQK